MLRKRACKTVSFLASASANAFARVLFSNFEESSCCVGI
jgi:hypothetical protein